MLTYVESLDETAIFSLVNEFVQIHPWRFNDQYKMCQNFDALKWYRKYIPTLAIVSTDQMQIDALSATRRNPFCIPVLKENEHGSVTRITASPSQTRLG
jgi:uncharacterized protein YcsI (UPF0317 family)